MNVKKVTVDIVTDKKYLW